MAASPDSAQADNAQPDNAQAAKGQIVKEGRLPVSEFLFDRAGAGSPYGEEIEFPLPVDGLVYRHPKPAAPRDR